jgi:hypothetical protein
MDGVIGVAVIVAFLVGLTGAAATPAGRRAMKDISSRLGGRAGADGQPGRPGRPGRSASTSGRLSGWADGLAGAVRAGIDKVRPRRGGGSATTKPTGPASPTGPDADTGPAAGYVNHKCVAAGRNQKCGSACFTDDDPDGLGDSEVGPEPQPTAATAPDGDTGPVPTETPDPNYVDAEEFWTTPPAVQAAPAEVAEPMPALTAADTAEPADTEDTMSQELDIVNAGVAISHQQARAALARIRGNVGLQRQIAAQNAAALSTLAAYWEQVGMDPVVLVAIYEAMMTSQTSRSSADLLVALADRVSGVLSSRGHDAVAAVAAGLNLAKDSGYYTQQ